jgi:CheY-like chemotaxis protein
MDYLFSERSVNVRANKAIKFLVVDDEIFVQTFTSRVLKHLGYANVETACDGEAALSSVTNARTAFDLIICDLNMPRMDGVQFLGKLKEAGYSGGLILLSGEDQHMIETVEVLAKAQQINILGAFKKPLEAAVLKQILDKYKSIA